MGSRSGEIEIVNQNYPGAGSHGGSRTWERLSIALGRDDGGGRSSTSSLLPSWLRLECAASGKGKVDTGRIKIISWDFLIICARVVQLLGARNDPISPSGLTLPACRAHWLPGGGRHEGRHGRVTELHRTPGRGADEHSLS